VFSHRKNAIWQVVNIPTPDQNIADSRTAEMFGWIFEYQCRSLVYMLIQKFGNLGFCFMLEGCQ